MIGRRSVLILLMNVIGGFMGYVGVLAIARSLPNPEETLGLVSFGIGFVGSFFVLTGLGVRAAHIKRVSQGEPFEQSLGTFILLKVLQAGLAVGATVLALYIWTDVLGRGFETPVFLPVIFIMLVYHIALTAADIGIATFTARLETARSETSHLVGTTVRVAGMIVVAVVGLGALDLAWAYTFGAVATGILALWLLFRHSRPARPPLRLIRSYMKFAFPLALPTALLALSLNIDKAIIQLFWGAAQVGYYFAAQLIVVVLMGVIISAISLLLFPTISRYHSRNEIDLLRVKSGQAERYLSLTLTPVVAFVLLYPEGVIHVLLSDAFLPAAVVLRLFVLTTYVVALTVPRGAILQGVDRSDLAGRVGLLGAVVTLGLYPVLIPTSIFGLNLAGLGPEGAVISLLAGNGAAFGLSLLYSHRIVGDRVQARILLHFAAAAATSLVFLLLVSPGSGMTWQWFHLIGFSLAFLGTYVALLTVVREFRRDDLQFFRDILDPRKMAEYIQRELRKERGP